MNRTSAPEAAFPREGSGVCWLAWERHRRTLELCRFLDLEPTIYASDLPRLVKHPLYSLKSLRHIISACPRTLIVQNPSIVLTLLACLMHRFGHFRLVVDTHNAGIAPENPLLARLKPLYRFFQREADLTVVTNDFLANMVRENGGRPLQLPDILPKPPVVRRIPLRGEVNIVFICTFGADEPYREVLEMARHLPGPAHLYVTGNFRKAPPQLVRNLPEQVTLTGFVPEADFWNLIASADLVMDLTWRDDCLVCGAYEAVAVGTPLLLSDTRALRTYFHQGAVFTGNDPRSIAENLSSALQRLPELRRQIASLKTHLETAWAEQGEKFRVFVKETA